MPDLNYSAILIYFALFLSLLVAFGPKTFTLNLQYRLTLLRLSRSLLGGRTMSILTQWVPNDPGRELLVHCLSHTMDETGSVPVMDEWYFAHRAWTSMLRGKINTHSVVVKVWRGAHMRTPYREKFTKRLSLELDKWKRASTHPNVAPFLGVMSGFGHLPSLVQPFYAHGNINYYLGNHPGADSLYMLCCVADGLTFMHNQTPSITHGGVRGANILISDSGVPQLSDVSVCSIPHSPDLTYIGGEFLGTRWMAPEVIDPPVDDTIDPPYDEVSYETPQSDVYSFGMTVLEVLSGRHPFAHRRLHTGVIFDVIQGIRPPRPQCAKLTDPVWDVVQSCWKQDPRERPRMNEVRAWLQLICLLQTGEGCKTGTGVSDVCINGVGVMNPGLMG